VGLRECRGCTRGRLLGAGGGAVVSSISSVMWQKRSFGVWLGGGDARAPLAAARGKGVRCLSGKECRTKAVSQPEGMKERGSGRRGTVEEDRPRLAVGGAVRHRARGQLGGLYIVSFHIRAQGMRNTLAGASLIAPPAPGGGLLLI